MQRRDFIRLLASAGITLATPIPMVSAAQEDELYTRGNFFVSFVAQGGWDPTNLCDPKGSTSDVDQSYETAAIQQAGNISYAPMPHNEVFFEKYHKELLVINGIDMIQAAHVAATRYIWTGNIESKIHPTFAAFYAASKLDGRLLPLGYISNAEYSNTGELIPLTRISPTVEGTNAIKKLMDIKHYNGNQNKNYQSAFSNAAIEAALKEENAAVNVRRVPKIKFAQDMLYSARLSSTKLKNLKQYLPSDFESIPALSRQISLILAAFKSGICISADISMGGFDTHISHETGPNSQNVRIKGYLEGVQYLMEAAESLGIRDRILLMMSSEFGRTPRLNADAGKDHWAVNSAMFIGPGVRGNRVIGASTPGHEAMGFDKNTLKPIDNKIFKIRPEHIHSSLRKLTGVDLAVEVKRFPLLDPKVAIDFFS